MMTCVNVTANRIKNTKWFKAASGTTKILHTSFLEQWLQKHTSAVHFTGTEKRVIYIARCAIKY